MPREHGAWGMLLVPFAVGVAVGGVFDLKVALLLASTICVFLARASWIKRQFRWTGLLAALAAAAAAPLFWVWRLWGLAGFAALAAPLAVRPNSAALSMQLLAASGLSLTAPAGWYTATGRLEATAFGLWFWNSLYFAGGVLYVRLRLARGGPVWPVLGFYAALLLFGLAWAAAGVISYGVPVAFAPSAMRAIIGAGRLQRPLRVRRLGWSEMGHAVLFGALLAVAMR